MNPIPLQECLSVLAGALLRGEQVALATRTNDDAKRALGGILRILGNIPGLRVRYTSGQQEVRHPSGGRIIFGWQYTGFTLDIVALPGCWFGKSGRRDEVQAAIVAVDRSIYHLPGSTVEPIMFYSTQRVEVES